MLHKPAGIQHHMPLTVTAVLFSSQRCERGLLPLGTVYNSDTQTMTELAAGIIQYVKHRHVSLNKGRPSNVV